MLVEIKLNEISTCIRTLKPLGKNNEEDSGMMFKINTLSITELPSLGREYPPKYRKLILK